MKQTLLHLQGFKNMNLSEHHITLTLICSGLSYGITEIVKPFWKAYTTKEKARALTRACAVLMGAGAGFVLTYETVDLLLGATAGVFNTTLVAKIKDKIKGDKSGDKNNN